MFEACAAHGVAVEINSRPERQDPPDEQIELAMSLGCLFSIDSDAHAPGQLSLIDYGAERAERLGVPPERIGLVVARGVVPLAHFLPDCAGDRLYSSATLVEIQRSAGHP